MEGLRLQEANKMVEEAKKRLAEKKAKQEASKGEEAGVNPVPAPAPAAPKKKGGKADGAKTASIAPSAAK